MLRFFFVLNFQQSTSNLRNGPPNIRFKSAAKQQSDKTQKIKALIIRSVQDVHGVHER